MKAQESSGTGQDGAMAAFIRDDDEIGDVLHVFGEVDLSNVTEFEDALARLASQPRVIVDLTTCSYMDSSGLRALAITHQKVQDRLMIVIPHGGSVHRLFEITGLAKQFNACDTLEEAIAKSNGQPPR